MPGHSGAIVDELDDRANPLPGSPVQTAEASPALQKVNILLVDDQLLALRFLEGVLSGLGQNLVKAESGEEALRILQERDFATILLDVQMPGMDGFETARLIRSREKTRHTPIIFVTASDEHRYSAEEAYLLGAVDYLTKPVVPVILRAKVSQFIELFQKTQQVERQAEKLRLLERHEFEQKLAAENARLRDEAIRAREEQFHTLADSIPQLAWMARADGHIVWYNKRWYEYTGATPEQVEGWGWQSVIDPIELPRVLENWKVAIATGEPWEDTFPLRRHDGNMRWHLSRAVPVKDEQGVVTGWFGTNTDITERMEMEAALKEADRRKDQFLATLAHELRNPIAPISYGLQVWPSIEGNRTEMENLRATMEQQVQQMIRLIDDLMDVSRVTRGKIQLRKQRIDLGTVLSGCIEAIEPLLKAHEHQLTVALPASPLFVEGDVARLTQVFGNLLNNAVKYTSRKGEIRASLDIEGGWAVVRIRDNGIGIPKEMLVEIFEMFRQVDQTLERSNGGLGIGLTLVKQLVELHGGSVEARSEGAGTGSEFVVKLPAVAFDALVPAGAPECDAGRARPRPCNLPQHRVLVVDDVPASAKTLAMMLKSIGQDVSMRHDGLAAIEWALANRPNVVFLDISMPGMNGYEVATRLRAEPALKNIILVALTGYGQEDDRLRALAAGFDQHITKPASIDSLERLLMSIPAT